jgi:hypothetical protein
LYGVLQQELETFLAEARAHADGFPRFVERELRGFLKCGILAHGFVRVQCVSCKHEHLVAFSCKGRGFCPSCCGKRMTRIAEHLIERVLPVAPVRQWVFTVPVRLRYKLAYDHALCSDVLRVFSRALLRSYRRRAREQGIARGQAGAITFIQRFGSALNLNVHFHTQALDGVFTQAADGALLFHPLRAPGDAEVRNVLEEVTCLLGPVLARHGVDDASDNDAPNDDTPLLAACYAGSVQGRTALGPRAGQPPTRFGAGGATPWVERHRNQYAELDGFDLHADVQVPAHARQRLEQLLRYCARPALSHDRLERCADGRLRLTLKTAWHDGTTHLLLTADDLLQRLVAIIPRPAKNLLVYHGVLAPNAKWRKQVIGYGRSKRERGPTRDPARCGHADGAERHRPNDDWARLMQRAFDIDVLACPRCAGRMTRFAIPEGVRLLRLVQSPRVAQRILRHLGLRDHAPPITPARTASLDFDDVA